MAKGDIFVRIGVDVSALEKALNKATDHIEKFGRQMKKIGSNLTQAITVPIVGLGYVAMRASKDATAQFEMFSANTKITMGKLGDEIAKSIDLKEVLSRINAVFDKTVDWFSKLDEETKKLVISTAAYSAALGPVLMTTGRIVEAVGAISDKIGFFVLLVYKVTAALVVLVAKFGAWPILVIAAVAGLVELAGGWEKVAEKAKEAWAWIEKAVKESAKYLPEAGSVLRTKGIPGTGFGVAPQSIGMAVNKPRALNEAPAGVEGVRDADTGQLNLFPYLGNTGFADTMEKINQYTVRGMGYLREWGAEAAAAGQQLMTGMVVPVDGTQAMIAAQRKLGLELETSGNKAQYHQGMIAALKQEYIALREGGFASTAPEIQKITEDLRAQNEALLNSQTAMDVFRQKLEEVPPIAVQFGNAIYSMYQQIADGIGSALAQVIVYGANLHQVLKQLLKAIAAEIIQTLVRIGIQYVITSAIKKANDLANAASSTASAVTTTYAEVFAQTSSLPFGWIIAAGVAAGAVALLIAGLAGAGGAAEGGIFTHSGMTRIAEKGKPEIVLNQDNVRKFMGGALGGGSQTIVVNLDSEPIISTVVRGMPAYLRLQGAI